MKDSIPQMVTVKQFSTLTGIAESSLRLWLKQGTLSPLTLSKGDLGTWTREAIAHIKLQALESDDELRLAKIRETTARASKLERENKTALGELCRADGVTAVWAAAFSTCKGRFMGLATTLADDLAGITDQAITKEIIQDAIQEILEELGGGAILTQTQKAELAEAKYEEMLTS